jgi:hypothetical protein
MSQAQLGKVSSPQPNRITSYGGAAKILHEWTDLTVPEWYKERAEGLIAKLGEERPDSKVFNAILATGQIEEKVIGHVHFIASRTKETDSLQLATDIVRIPLQLSKS